MLRSEVLASLAACAASAAVQRSARARSETAYRAAVRTIEADIDADRANRTIAGSALPRLYHYGERVRNVVVLLHGFTNCPQQFDELARRLYQRGCNVYVPRLPLHGYRDRLTMALGALTIGDISSATVAYLSSARDLGERVTVIGLSLGGAMALDLVQRCDVDHAVAVAPFLMPIGIPSVIGLPAMRVLTDLPDEYLWWDPRVKEQCRPLYAYPGFPTHALATIVEFAETVVAAGRAFRPLGRKCTLVMNSNESAVNNGSSLDLLSVWNRYGMGYASVSLGGLGPPRHDIIDPTTFPAARKLVYPLLEKLVFGE